MFWCHVNLYSFKFIYFPMVCASGKVYNIVITVFLRNFSGLGWGCAGVHAGVRARGAPVNGSPHT